MKDIKLMFVLTIQKKPRITNWVLCNLNQREPGRLKTGYCVLKAKILQQKTRNLKRHVENKHKGVRYPFSQCEFAANTARVLKKHVRNKHEGLGYFFSLCEFAASTLGNLKSPVEIKHKGVRYPCSTCEYVASREANLKRHFEVYSKE